MPAPQPPHEGWLRKNFTALVVALIAMTATLTSSFVAYNATEMQAESARQQSSDEFRRTKQKDAYAALLASNIKLRDVEVQMRPQSKSSPLYTPGNDRFVEDFKKFNAAFADFTQALAAVELMGSKKIRDAVHKLQEAHREVAIAYITVSAALSPASPNPVPVGEMEAFHDFDVKVAKTAELEGVFIEVARQDLGI